MALIMVVEDDAAINALMALTLRVEDYEVIQARDGQQALDLLEQHQPDLILLDVMMPRMSGYEVAQALQDKPSTARIPIIFVTAKSQMEDRVRGLDLAVDYVCKPFAAPELLARVRAAIRIQRLQEELRVSNEQLKHLATTDALTGLCNRRHFDNQLSDELMRAQRYNHAIAVVLFDLDYFKGINDRFGHEQGDLVLRAFGEVLRRSSRRIDTIARMGGEEFVAILPETDEAGARAFAEKVRLNTKALQIPAPGSLAADNVEAAYTEAEDTKFADAEASDVPTNSQTEMERGADSTSGEELQNVASTRDEDSAMSITVSAGVVVLPPREPDEMPLHRPEATLVQFADKLLYAAKNAGRDCVHSHTLSAADLQTLSRGSIAPLHDGS